MSAAQHSDATLTVREAFLKHYDTEDLCPRSVKRLLGECGRWEKYTDNPPIGEITNETVAKFRTAASVSLSPSTVNTTWSGIRSILRRVGPQSISPRGLGIIPTVPYMKRCRFVRSIPRRISLDDLSRVYIACKHAKFPRGSFPARDWWRTLIVLAYCTGLRKSDLLSLACEQFDLANAELYVVARKTSKPDLFPLRKEAVEHVQRIWLPARKRLFTGLYKLGGRFYHYWHELQDHAGIEEHFHLHDIRRTGASEIERARPGMGKVFLQHKPRDVTGTFYLNATEELKETIEKMRIPVAFGPGPKMTDRATAKAAEEARRLHAADFEVPTKPDAREWQFGQGQACFRGRWFRIAGSHLRLLQRLALAPSSQTWQELLPAIRQYRPGGAKLPQHKVHVIVSRVRNILRRVMGLEDGFDPVPCLEVGNGGTWTLNIPTTAVPRDMQSPWVLKPGDITGEQLRAARVAAKMTHADLSRRTGIPRIYFHNWEVQQEPIPEKHVAVLRSVLLFPPAEPRAAAGC